MTDARAPKSGSDRCAGARSPSLTRPAAPSVTVAAVDTLLIAPPVQRWARPGSGLPAHNAGGSGAPARSTTPALAAALSSRSYTPGATSPTIPVRGMWRYADRLPLDDAARAVSLGEGDTPLIDLPRLREALGVAWLGLKSEHLNPTGSFKDRVASVGLSIAVERELAGCIGTSSGNGGAAATAYGARAGRPVYLFVAPGVAELKLAQIQALGARVWLAPDLGSDGAATERTAVAIAEAAAEHRWFPMLTERAASRRRRWRAPRRSRSSSLSRPATRPPSTSRSAEAACWRRSGAATPRCGRRSRARPRGWSRSSPGDRRHSARRWPVGGGCCPAASPAPSPGCRCRCSSKTRRRPR